MEVRRNIDYYPGCRAGKEILSGMHIYDDILEALFDLKQRGFTTDFNINTQGLECRESGIILPPEEFEIVEHYRFEADTNPSDSSVLYVIEAPGAGIKGILINAYGVYSDAVSEKLIQQLQVHE